MTCWVKTRVGVWIHYSSEISVPALTSLERRVIHQRTWPKSHFCGSGYLEEILGVRFQFSGRIIGSVACPHFPHTGAWEGCEHPDADGVVDDPSIAQVGKRWLPWQHYVPGRHVRRVCFSWRPVRCYMDKNKELNAAVSTEWSVGRAISISIIVRWQYALLYHFTLPNTRRPYSSREECYTR